MYKLINNMKNEPCGVTTQVGNVLYSIPFDPANTNYQTFREEVLAGAVLQDADGYVMTDAFIGTLP